MCELRRLLDKIFILFALSEDYNKSYPQGTSLVEYEKSIRALFKVKPCIGKEARIKNNEWPLYTGGIGAAAIFSIQATMSRSHSMSPFLSLSFVDQSQRSPSLAPFYLCRALVQGTLLVEYEN